MKYYIQKLKRSKFLLFIFSWDRLSKFSEIFMNFLEVHANLFYLNFIATYFMNLF